MFSKTPAIESENDWSFGQILPVFFLIAPVISMLEVFRPGGTADLDRTAWQDNNANGYALHPIPVDNEAHQQNHNQANDGNLSGHSHSSAINQLDPEIDEQLDEYDRSMKEDYYSLDDSDKMITPAILLLLQVVATTTFLFVFLTLPNTSAILMLTSYGYGLQIFLYFPSLCFLLLTIGILSRVKPGWYTSVYRLGMLALVGYSICLLLFPDTLFRPQLILSSCLMTLVLSMVVLRLFVYLKSR